MYTTTRSDSEPTNFNEKEEEAHEIRQKWMERVLTSPSNPIKSANVAPKLGTVKVIKRPKPLQRRRRKSILIEQSDVDRIAQQRKIEKENRKESFLIKKNEKKLELLSSDLPTQKQFMNKLSSTLIEIPENGYVNNKNIEIPQTNNTIEYKPILMRRKEEEKLQRELNYKAMETRSMSLDDVMDQLNEYDYNEHDDDDEETKNNDWDDNTCNQRYKNQFDSRIFARGTSLDSIIIQENGNSKRQRSKPNPRPRPKPIIKSKSFLERKKHEKKSIRNKNRNSNINKQGEGDIDGRNSPDSVLNYDNNSERHHQILDKQNKKKDKNNSFSSIQHPSTTISNIFMSKRGTSLDSAIPTSIVSIGGDIPKASSAVSEKARINDSHMTKRIGYTI